MNATRAALDFLTGERLRRRGEIAAWCFLAVFVGLTAWQVMR